MNYCPNCGKEIEKIEDFYVCKYCNYKGKESFTREEIKNGIKKLSNKKTTIFENKKFISALIAIIWIIIVTILVLLR